MYNPDMKAALTPHDRSESVVLTYEDRNNVIRASGGESWISPLLEYLRSQTVKLLEIDMLKHFDRSKPRDAEAVHVSPAYTQRAIVCSDDFVSAVLDVRWEYGYDVDFFD